MNRCEGPPPGFGAATAGGRPLRRDFGGTMSAIPASTMVHIKTETDDVSLEVQQQSQMQNEAMASQCSCPAKSSLAGNKNASREKAQYMRIHADATKVASPGVNASNTGQHSSPCTKSKGLGKHDKLEDNRGATELRRLQTPINLFEDECVFCHSFRTSEKLHGPLVQYRDGRIVSSDKGNPNKSIYVHKNCMDWAPRVYLDGDDIVNVEKELSRASRLKCSRCRLPGAALGCYHHPCAKTYHVPCAMMTPECVWDVENRHVWCPKHASDLLPCDLTNSLIMESDITSPILQKIEDQQVDQPDNSSFSSLPQGQCSDKGLSALHRREEEVTESRTFVNQWVLLGSVLSTSEKDFLKEFASLTSSNLAEKWDTEKDLEENTPTQLKRASLPTIAMLCACCSFPVLVLSLLCILYILPTVRM